MFVAIGRYVVPGIPVVATSCLYVSINAAKVHREAKPHGTSSRKVDSAALLCIPGGVPNLRVVAQRKLVAEILIYLIAWCNRDRQRQVPVQDVDILAEVPAVEGMVVLKPHRLVLVLCQERARGHA